MKLNRLIFPSIIVLVLFTACWVIYNFPEINKTVKELESAPIDDGSGTLAGTPPFKILVPLATAFILVSMVLSIWKGDQDKEDLEEKDGAE